MQETSFLDNAYTTDSMVENLKTMPVLEPFEDQELAKLLEMSKVRKYEAGECIVQEGHTDTWVYFLMLGQIRISKKGKEIAILTEKGEVFGEIGALERSRRSASAHAATSTVCLAADIFYLEKLTGATKQAFGYIFYRLMTEVLTRRLRQTTDELINTKGRINLKFW